MFFDELRECWLRIKVFYFYFENALIKKSEPTFKTPGQNNSNKI